MSPNFTIRRKLTDRLLESIKPPHEGRVTYSDEAEPGLLLRVGTRKASWVYERRVRGGPKRKHTLGAYCTWGADGRRQRGGISLAQAREKAAALKIDALNGVDTVAEVRRASLEAERIAASRKTVGDVLAVYEDLKLSSLRTGAQRARDLRKVLSADLDTPIENLSKSSLQAAIDEKTARGKRVFANRIRSYLRAFTKWAATRDYLKEDIGYTLQGAGHETPRDRVLSLREVRTIYSATFDTGSLWGPVFRLLILTGQRRGEILGLRWSNVEFENRRISMVSTQTKNMRAHITHLSDAAYSELSELRDGQEDDAPELVFTTTGTTAASGISQAKSRLDKIIGDQVAPWRLHDLRRAMATALAGAGVPEGVVDRIQNHAASSSAPSAVARVYQQSDLLPQRAAALDRWAEMVTKTSASVTTLGAVR